MNVKQVIENSELHYTASKLIDEESFEQMVKELSESIESNLDSQVMSYLRYYIEKRKEINKIKEIWKDVCIEPNIKPFSEFIKE